MSSPVRVVFVPGFMGSRLYLESMDFEASRRICRNNLDFLPDKLFKSCDDRKLTDLSPLWGRVCLEYPPCSTDPRNLWGDLDMFHWAASPADWQSSLTHGNGYSIGSDGAGIVRPRGLLDIQIRGRELVSGEFSFGIAPYRRLLLKLQALKDEVDLLVFDYDWRLSCVRNAELLAERIHGHWWPGYTPKNVRPEERIVIIGHSLGGLVARLYIEDEALDGARFTRQLITAGTPHLGAPEVYSNVMGYTRAFPFGLFGESVRKLGEILVSGSKLMSDALGSMNRNLGEVFSSYQVLSRADLDFLPTHLMPLSVQKYVLARCASVMELLPQYDFVSKAGSLEPISDTLKGVRFRGSIGLSSGEVVKSFITRLASPGQLDCFLLEKGTVYTLLAATGVETTVGFDGQNVRAATGDGVVPEQSAALKPYSDRAKNVDVQLIGPKELKGREHQELLDVDSIQTSFIKLALSAPYVVPRPLVTIGPVFERTKELVKIASGQSDEPDKKLFRAQAGRKFVVTLVSLRFTDSRYPVLSASLQRADGKLFARGPGFANWPVQTVGDMQIAYMGASTESGSRYFGGAVLIPRPCSDVLELMTWNVGGGSQARNLSCDDKTHAEAQLAFWLEAQKPEWPWASRINQIDVVNRSTRSGPGVSPCSPCARGLSVLLKSLRQMAGGRLSANLSWAVDYVVGPESNCNHIGDFGQSDRNLLVSAGWKLQ